MGCESSAPPHTNHNSPIIPIVIGDEKKIGPSVSI